MLAGITARKNESSCFIMLNKVIVAILSCVFVMTLPVNADSERDKLIEEARKAVDRADPIMGDWQGSWKLDDESDSGTLVAQVIALGQGEYRANFHGEFDHVWPPLFVLTGKLKEATAQFSGQPVIEDSPLKVQSIIKDGKFTGKFKGGTPDTQHISGSFTMKKVVRLSPTLGAKPPEGAIVLFDGKNFDEWEPIRPKPGIDSIQWKLLEDGAMEVKPGTSSIITKKKFTNVKLHLEFRTPFMPDARGQARGNSGVYLQGRYEVQVLDSYGLEGLDNECGGIYKVAQPLVNMCAPPTQWQTYDITFYANGVNVNGEKTGPVMTVLHNGTMIHYKVKASKPTTAAPDQTQAGPGGIYLQDHNNPVQFRNIWLVELPDATT